MTESAPGGALASLDRRNLFQVAALLSLSSAIALAPARAAASSEEDYQAFLGGLGPLKAMLPPGVPSLQNAYVHLAAAHALRVDDFPVPRFFPMGSFRGVEIGPVMKAEPFMITRYRLGPHAVLPPHDHPNYSVATLGLGGEASVLQFELDGEAPAHGVPGPFIVRETSRRILRSSDVVTLSPSRDNIHTFRAGANGAEFIDITTSHGPDVGFSYVELKARPLGGSGDRYSAAWTRFE